MRSSWLLATGLALSILGATGSSYWPGEAHEIPAPVGPHHRYHRPPSPSDQPPGPASPPAPGFVELATGLNRWDEASRSWVPACAQFERTPVGSFRAAGTQHQVLLAPNLRSEGAVDLLTPDGVRLRSSVLGIALGDPGRDVQWLLAEVQDSVPELLGPGEVLYPDALDGLAGEVRYRLGLNFFEQDVILRERIPSEWLRELGMDPERAQVVVLTEFFDPPVPQQESRTRLRREREAQDDVRLRFGAMSIESGKAFALGSGGERSAAGPDALENESAGVPVVKKWARLDGRSFLVETVAYADLAPLMEALPVPEPERSAALKTRARRVATLRWPPRDLRQAQAPSDAPGSANGRLQGPTAHWSSVKPPGSGPRPAASDHGRWALFPGLVLDYVMVTSQAHHTFRADTTYYVTGQVDLTGTTTLEGGAVIKFPPTNTAARIYVRGPLLCATGPYRPAIFTARDDNSVGETLPGSTGTPSGWYGGYALYAYDTASVVDVRHLKVSHLTVGVGFYGNVSNRLRHAQLLNTKYPVYACSAGPVSLENLLVVQVGPGGRVVQNVGTPASVTAAHLTVDTAPEMSTWTLQVRNSLLVALGTPGGYSGDHNVVLPSGSEVFASAGAGAHYLVPGSPYRNAGAQDLAADLLADLATRTTEEPVQWNLPISTDTVWDYFWGVERDDDRPDLGYHYPALDYVCGNLLINGATLTLTSGVAVGVYGSTGLKLAGAAQLRSEGCPTFPNQIVRAVSVQELTPSGWAAGVNDALLGEDASATAASALRLRFSELGVPGGVGYHFRGGAKLGTLVLQDCELSGGGLAFNLAGTYARTVALTNNLLARLSYLSLGTGTDATLTTYARHNLFRACAAVNLNAAPGNGWEWKDNLFDTTTLWQYYGGVANGYNAYRSCPQPLTPAGTGNRTLTALSYAHDAWGRPWYVVSTPTLVNVGSRSAAAAGLYHYTTQTNQAPEGATQVDIGWHRIPLDPETGKAMDSDHDGLPDYWEDQNGNGVLNPGETDPNNPVTYPSPGKPDPLLGIPLAELRLRGYTNTALLRYASTQAPDASFAMRWRSWARSSVQKAGDFTRLSPPPGYVREGIDQVWPSVAPGTETWWREFAGGGRTSALLNNNLEFPSAAALPWERCAAGAFTNGVGDVYTRRAHSEVGLLGGSSRHWPKSTHSVVLSLMALDKSSGSAVPWAAHQYFLNEPSTTWQGEEIDPASREVRVAGRVVDAHGLVMVRVPVGKPVPVTPAIAGCPWYQFSLTPASPVTVQMSWSRHPSCSAVDLQGLYDEAALHLAEDNDERVKNGDPRLNDPAFRNGDDVPAYLEFLVLKARRSTFPSQFAVNGLTHDFTSDLYSNVVDFQRLMTLCAARFANVKLVNTIKIDEVPYGGMGVPGMPGIVLARNVQVGGQPPQSLDWLTAVHEYGHTAGLEHRGLVVPPPAGHQPNPGDVNDPSAIMHHRHRGGKEVNRFERDKFTTWNPPLWNE